MQHTIDIPKNLGQSGFITLSLHSVGRKGCSKLPQSKNTTLGAPFSTQPMWRWCWTSQKLSKKKTKPKTLFHKVYRICQISPLWSNLHFWLMLPQVPENYNLSNQFLMVVCWNMRFSCNDLKSSNRNNHVTVEVSGNQENVMIEQLDAGHAKVMAPCTGNITGITLRSGLLPIVTKLTSRAGTQKCHKQTKDYERNIMQRSLPLKMKQNIPIFGSKCMMLTLQGSMETNLLVLIWFRFVKFLLNPNWKHFRFVKQFSPIFSMDQAEFETAFLLICNTGFGARVRQVLGAADTGFFGGRVSKMQSQSFRSGESRNLESLQIPKVPKSAPLSGWCEHTKKTAQLKTTDPSHFWNLYDHFGCSFNLLLKKTH